MATVEPRSPVHLLVFLLARKRWLVAALVGGALAGLVAAWTLPVRYTAKLYVQTPGMLFTEYRKYASALDDRERLLAYVAKRERGDEVARALRPMISGAEGTFRIVRPHFAVTRGDIRELAEQFKDTSTFVGFEVLLESSDEQTARAAALAVAEYVRELLLGARIDDLLTTRSLAVSSDLAKQRTAEMSITAERTAATAKREGLEKVSQRYGSLPRIDARQVVSVQDGGARYLPLVVQIVGVEAFMVELDERLAKARNEIAVATALLDIYARGRDAVARAEPGSPRGPLLALRAVWAEVDGRKGDVVPLREALARVDGEITQLELQFPPRLPLMGAHDAVTRRMPGRRVEFAATGAAAGVLVWLAWVLGSYWRREVLPREASL